NNGMDAGGPGLAARNNHVNKKRLLPALLGLLLATGAASIRADNQEREHERGRDPAPAKVIPFSTALVRIEVNATDGDSGFHVLLDAPGWRFVKIYDPSWRLIFEVEGGGSIRKTGLTELFFESAEPGFEELPLEEF